MRKDRDENIFGACEAKTHVAELLKKVEAGVEITITKDGSPVAKLVPVRKRTTVENRKVAIKRIRQLGQGISLKGVKIRELIDEGRSY